MYVYDVHALSCNAVVSQKSHKACGQSRACMFFSNGRVQVSVDMYSSIDTCLNGPCMLWPAAAAAAALQSVIGD